MIFDSVINNPWFYVNGQPLTIRKKILDVEEFTEGYFFFFK